jgi:lipopolysaccharide transport system ATP-binding protein
MSDIVIKAENLGKKYTIGHQAENGGYVALRDVLMQNARDFWHKTKDLVQGKPIILGDTLEEVWALKEVSFEIQRGEAVGIIGRNGAGKSTLLKVLSRITEPSAGRVTIKGRVASLLEVGTGFHPELTGRENIYLNGAILGMRRAEIKRKYDEIVAFAEVEKFLDTPVKRYSSGMYVRLAFAVAAHLEPEILVVDEVLAVGDAAFQQKCLGKMSDVAQQGRTVLFVSHNMAAIVSLCRRCLLLSQGAVVQDGTTTQVVADYQSYVLADLKSTSDLTHFAHHGSGKARFTAVTVTPLKSDGQPHSFLYVGQDLLIDTRIEAISGLNNANIAAIIYDSSGYRLIDVNTALQRSFVRLEAGQSVRVQFRLRDVRLKPGYYVVGLWLGRGGIEEIDNVNQAATFSVEPDPYAILHTEVFPGTYQCQFTHDVQLGAYGT